MRIAVWHNLPSGGGKRALYDQVRGLVGRGHHVEAWCPDLTFPPFLPLTDLIAEHRRPFNWSPQPARGRVGRWTQPYRDMVAKVDAMDAHARACAVEIERGGFDLLLCHPCFHFRTTPLARHVALPSVLYLQEPFRDLYEALPRLPWVAPPPREGRLRRTHVKAYVLDLIDVQAKRVQMREEQRWAADFDRLLVNSHFSRESVLRAYNLDSTVCYLGVDVGAFQPTSRPKERFVVGLGSIHVTKGVALALAAVGAVPREVRPALVWITNFVDPNYRKRLEATARELEVEFVPKVLVPDAELVDLLGRAAAMVYTSRLEPFGYAPLEANACGTAVVAVPEGGVRETVRNGVNGTLVAEATPRAIAEALTPYVRNLALAKDAGMIAREYVCKMWALEDSIDRLEERLRRSVAPQGEGRFQDAYLMEGGHLAAR